MIKKILNYFSQKKKGRFLDVGAFDGVKHSNTYHLWKSGWFGVYVEPSVTNFLALKNNINRRCDLYNIALSSKSEIVKFHDCKNGDVWGVSTIKQAHADSWTHGHFSEHFKPAQYEQYFTKTATWNQLLNSCGNNFDFISIDVEGANCELLRSLPFKRLKKVKLICIEKDNDDVCEEYTKIFENNGFRLHSQDTGNLMFAAKKSLANSVKLL